MEREKIRDGGAILNWGTGSHASAGGTHVLEGSEEILPQKFLKSRKCYFYRLILYFVAINLGGGAGTNFSPVPQAVKTSLHSRLVTLPL